MTFNPKHIAAEILDNPETLAVLSTLEAEDLRVQLWHFVAGIVINHYLAESNGDAPPDIDSVTDSVLPIVSEALNKPR